MPTMFSYTVLMRRYDYKPVVTVQLRIGLNVSSLWPNSCPSTLFVEAAVWSGMVRQSTRMEAEYQDGARAQQN